MIPPTPFLLFSKAFVVPSSIDHSSNFFHEEQRSSSNDDDLMDLLVPGRGGLLHPVLSVGSFLV
jgi:hypothetical protein